MPGQHVLHPAEVDVAVDLGDVVGRPGHVVLDQRAALEHGDLGGLRAARGRPSGSARPAGPCAPGPGGPRARRRRGRRLRWGGPPRSASSGARHPGDRRPAGHPGDRRPADRQLADRRSGGRRRHRRCGLGRPRRRLRLGPPSPSPSPAGGVEEAGAGMESPILGLRTSGGALVAASGASIPVDEVATGRRTSEASAASTETGSPSHGRSGSSGLRGSLALGARTAASAVRPPGAPSGRGRVRLRPPRRAAAPGVARPRRTVAAGVAAAVAGAIRCGAVRCAVVIGRGAGGEVGHRGDPFS